MNDHKISLRIRDGVPPNKFQDEDKCYRSLPQKRLFVAVGTLKLLHSGGCDDDGRQIIVSGYFLRESKYGRLFKDNVLRDLQED